jgi:hypothetical protein
MKNLSMTRPAIKNEKESFTIFASLSGDLEIIGWSKKFQDFLGDFNRANPDQFQPGFGAIRQ